MAKACVMCPRSNPNVAAVYCEADACYLCVACDVEVHSANRLAQRHVRRPVTAAESSAEFSVADDSESSLVPDIVGSVKIASGRFDASKSSVISTDSCELPMETISFEDAADYDFYDFANLSGKMPTLDIEDESVLQTCKAFGIPATSELSWESMIPDTVEHVVPDVGSVTMSPVTSFTAGNEPISDTEVPPDKVSSQPTWLSKLSKTSVASVSSSAISTLASSEEDYLPQNSVIGNDLHMECNENTRPGTELEKTPQALPVVCNVKNSAEQRRKMRLEALERFRNKRANRSFTKKVRYECRKQLADSRPRVKGRFVKKSEMALYRKYGAMYREHMDELRPQSSTTDQCVPAL